MTIRAEGSSFPRVPRKWRTAISSTALLLSTLPGALQADVQPLHWYRMGDELNPRPVRGSALLSLHDWIGTLDLQGSAPYGQFGAGPGNSNGATFTSSYSLSNSTGWYQANALPEVEEFGFEAWVRPTNATGGGTIAGNGVPGVNGWSISLNQGVFAARVGTNTIQGVAPQSANGWTHVALIRTKGVTRLLLNGISVGRSDSLIPAATGRFTIGAMPPSTDGGSATLPFTGLIDEVRHFGITGAFSPTTDLLYFPAQLLVNFAGDLATSRLINFGTQPTGAPISTSLILRDGNLNIPVINPLHISSITLSGPDAAEFALERTPFTETPGLDNSRVQVTLTALTPGPKSATLTVVTNDPFFNPLAIALTANAVAAPSIQVYQGDTSTGQMLSNNAGILDFPSTAPGSASPETKSFTIRNSGLDVLSLSSVSIGGADASSFIFVHAPSASSLQPGESTTFTVNFAPTAPRREARGYRYPFQRLQ